MRYQPILYAEFNEVNLVLQMLFAKFELEQT